MSLTTSPCKKDFVTKTPTRNLQHCDCHGPSEPSQATMTSSSKSQQEAVVVRLGGSLRWTPEGKRKRGRPRSTSRRTADTELQSLNLNWGQASRLASDRREWRKLVDALCTTGRQGPMMMKNTGKKELYSY